MTTPLPLSYGEITRNNGEIIASSSIRLERIDATRVGKTRLSASESLTSGMFCCVSVPILGCRPAPLGNPRKEQNEIGPVIEKTALGRYPQAPSVVLKQ